LENKYQTIERISLDDVIRVRGLVVLLVGRGDAHKFNSNADLVKETRNKLNSHVLVVESRTSDRRFMEDLFRDQRIVTINTVWLPGETSETRVILERRGVRRLSKKRISEISRVSKIVRNIDLRIEYIN
jgi:transcription antitermination factor NusA-like protein